jgi:hypothetical protein
MMKPSVSPNGPVALPPLIAAYAEATNSFDLERLMATFARRTEFWDTASSSLRIPVGIPDFPSSRAEPNELDQSAKDLPDERKE